MKKENKMGQVAIFVIVAIAVVAVIAIIIYLFPQFNVFVSDLNPNAFLAKCIEPEVDIALERLSNQGGVLEPDNYVMYQGNNIQYLCYTSQLYQPCVVQQPLLKQKVETEIKNFVEPKARECVSNLADEYEGRGFKVTTKPGELNVKIEPDNIFVEFLSPMTVQKEDTETFQQFRVSKNSEMYDLLLTATSIIQFESTLGDSSTDLYIQYYPDLKIEKLKREGDAIYKVSNVVTGESFSFASRSLVWPAGYGFDEI